MNAGRMGECDDNWIDPLQKLNEPAMPTSDLATVFQKMEKYLQLENDAAEIVSPPATRMPLR
jgi:hypothetical protein